MKEIKIKEKHSRYFKFEYFVSRKPVARAFLYLIHNDLHPNPYGLLEDVFVEENYRKQGIGKKLVKAVIKKAKKLGCYKLIATSRFERKKVHRFYESLGFQKWGIEFKMNFKRLTKI